MLGRGSVSETFSKAVESSLGGQPTGGGGRGGRECEIL
eukprot:CAMPEP_0194764432 /NCGR_PEP_ID=MMETSP0323_2-20130528/22777_1 /TAXON_ID=2866 ORGANISM="Crypthecodinium cohnii, Strain Seligo" /NCGR_SAMPLE_ID=MMETSP0323_2 /ASSEMBLY_ACC=CAM_ASM_000346 /LENGTH=37 /DNA_ID= /DNA_START= /DNA_END= /DNA_ORIENTATION=